MGFCAPSRKKIESCVDDKLDFVFERLAEGFHTVPSGLALPVPLPLSSVSRLASPSPPPFPPPLLSTSDVHTPVRTTCGRRSSTGVLL